MDMKFLKKNAPCYVYEKSKIIRNCKELQQHLQGFDLLYSIKTNPHEEVVTTISGCGFGADAASPAEVDIALAAGMKAEDIYYSSPGKDAEDIEATLGRCVLIADSLGEIQRINGMVARLCRERGGGEAYSVQRYGGAYTPKAKLGLRINPDFGMDASGTNPSKFGVDMGKEKELKKVLQTCQHVELNGIHIHVKSQVLDAEAIGKYYENCFRAVTELNKMSNANIEYINFGSGIGTVYDYNIDAPVDLKVLSIAAAKIREFNQDTIKAKLLIETGRFVVCHAGTYYTKVVDIKESCGVKYLIVKNGMNGFMRPAIAGLVGKVCGDSQPIGYEPLYTTQKLCRISVLNEEREQELVNVVGNLCTAMDILGEGVVCNKAEVGDIVAVSNAGSYGYSLSPVLFSGHKLPAQIVVD